MILYDPERRWLDRAACREGVNPERFHFSGNSQLRKTPAKATQEAWNDAKKVCRFCPVLEECRRDSLGEEYGVWGGLDEHQRYNIRNRLGKGGWKKWPEEKQLAWGEHLAYLRKQDVLWKSVTMRTGLSRHVCEALIEVWEKHQELVRGRAARAAALVVDIPLPEPPASRLKDFPAVSGQRHAWVRNRGLIADGWYAGETEDGVWIKMQVFSGRGNVIKFFRAQDVRFYNPQPRWTVPYHGRPDADDVQEDAHAA